ARRRLVRALATNASSHRRSRLRRAATAAIFGAILSLHASRRPRAAKHGRATAVQVANVDGEVHIRKAGGEAGVRAQTGIVRVDAGAEGRVFGVAAALVSALDRRSLETLHERFP